MKIFFKILCLSAFLIAFAQCKKDKNILNTSVQPAGDLVNADYIGSLPVYAHTIKYDSIAIADDRYRFLGSNQDPVFGRTDIGLYVSPVMNTSNLKFDSCVFQSAEIILTINGTNFTGDASAPLSYFVFPLKDTLDPNHIYYSRNTGLFNSNSLIGNITGAYTTKDGKAVIRIPLNDNFAKTIFENPDKLTDNGTFQRTYKGFYIATGINPANSQGVIFKCDLNDALSGFYLNYKNAAGRDTNFRFLFTGASATRFNTAHFQFDNNGNTSLQQQVLGGDTTQGAQNLFLKGMGATKLKVQIPSITSYADSSFAISVNRAEVVFNVDLNFLPDTLPNKRYGAPARLLLLPMDELSRETFSPDQLQSNNDYRFDGNYDSDKKRYVFNIARYAQQVMNGTRKNYGFYLVIANAPTIYDDLHYGNTKELLTVRRDNYVERIVLAGSSHSSLKPAFNLTYIKLKKE